jgi:large subunit ribosomal protein L18e
MSHKSYGPEDFELRKLIRRLHKTRRRIWRMVSKILSKPRKNTVEVNLYRINTKTKDGDIIVVPGKLLSIGELNHKVTIACWNASKTTRKKVDNSNTGSKIITINELLEINPTGSNVKIFI